MEGTGLEELERRFKVHAKQREVIARLEQRVGKVRCFMGGCEALLGVAGLLTTDELASYTWKRWWRFFEFLPGTLERGAAGKTMPLLPLGS